MRHIFDLVTLAFNLWPRPSRSTQRSSTFMPRPNFSHEPRCNIFEIWIILSRIIGRGYKFGPVILWMHVWVCLSVSHSALSWLDCLTYRPKIWWRDWPWPNFMTLDAIFSRYELFSQASLVEGIIWVPSFCVSHSVLSWLNCLTYRPKIWWINWPWQHLVCVWTCPSDRVVRVVWSNTPPPNTPVLFRTWQAGTP